MNETVFVSSWFVTSGIGSIVLPWKYWLYLFTLSGSWCSGLFTFRLYGVRVSGLFIIFGLCADSIDKLSAAGDSCTEESTSEDQLTPKRLAGDVLFSLVSLGSLCNDLTLSDSSVLVDGFISTFSEAWGMAFSPFLIPLHGCRGNRGGLDSFGSTGTKWTNWIKRGPKRTKRIQKRCQWTQMSSLLLPEEGQARIRNFCSLLTEWITVKYYILIGRVHL